MTHPPSVRLEVIEPLLARLAGPPVDHERFVGVPVDTAGLTPLELGRLWAALRRVGHSEHPTPAASAAAADIRRHATESGLVPALDEASSLEVFRDMQPLEWQVAVDHLGYMACELTAELRAELRRILGEPAQWTADRHPDVYKLHALSVAADVDVREALHALTRERHAGSSIRLQELEQLQLLGFESLLALAGSQGGYFMQGIDKDAADPAEVLAHEASYVDFSHHVLVQARDRVADIHAGRIPYVADGFCTPEDAQVIARAARIALVRDEPWLPPLLGEILPGVCVAPTAAKTVPSQSLATALGHSIERHPTPEGVQALKQALSAVRHAGVEKKLARNLKPAERGLAQRPMVALRLAVAAKPDKTQLATLAACLEAGWWQGMALGAAEWRERLLEPTGTAAMARSLVWTMARPDGSTASFMPVVNGKTSRFIGSTGQPLTLPDDGRISLWHPASANEDERLAWRGAVVAARLKQPFRQAFREHYAPLEEELALSAASVFADHVVSIRPLLGLARREGWRVQRDGDLERDFGAVRASFRVEARLYPGAEGHASTGGLTFMQRDQGVWRPMRLADVSTVVFSEACRAVDLLVSTSAFASEQETQPEAGFDDRSAARRTRLAFLAGRPLGEMTRMRREALRTVFSEAVSTGRLRLEERHAFIGDFAVHLSTARITHNGTPVTLPPDAEGGTVLAAVPWLPYDEVLLQQAAEAVAAVLAGWTSQHGAP